MEIGFLIRYFRKLPHELGEGEAGDIGLLNRALQAVHIHQLAERYTHGEIGTFRTFSDSDWEIILPILEALGKPVWVRFQKRLERQRIQQSKRKHG